MRTCNMTGLMEASDKEKTVPGRFDNRWQVGARIQQPDLAFHGEGVAALLHDRRPLAVVFADDHQRALRGTTK